MRARVRAHSEALEGYPGCIKVLREDVTIFILFHHCLTKSVLVMCVDLSLKVILEIKLLLIFGRC